jgi:hypothetical protein
MQALQSAATAAIPTSLAGAATSLIPTSLTGAATSLTGAATTPSIIPKIPVWLYRLVAAFPMTGMAGIDHYLLGSQQTAFAKFLVNLLTFGSWYVYDILQSLDADKVSDRGLDFPFYGGGAVGKGKMAADAKDLGPTGEAFLNLIFACVAGVLYLVSHYVLEKEKPPVDNVAKVVSPILLTATTGLLALVAYGLFKGATSVSGLAGAAGIGGLAGVAGLASIPGVPSIPGLPSIPSMPSIPGLTKQAGGAKGEGLSTDFLALGTLTLIAGSGFILSAVRSRGAL